MKKDNFNKRYVYLYEFFQLITAVIVPIYMYLLCILFYI